MLNTENGYEYLSGYATNKKQVHHTNKVRRAAWRIVCSGGYVAAGFISTIGHSDVWDRIDPTSRHPFLVKDSGAGAQLALLYDFFQALPFWRMEPIPSAVRGDALCFAVPGEVYVVYAPHGGEFSVDPGSKPVNARWFNPRSGGFQASTATGATFTAPDGEDWALVVNLT